MHKACTLAHMKVTHTLLFTNKVLYGPKPLGQRGDLSWAVASLIQKMSPRSSMKGLVSGLPAQFGHGSKKRDVGSVSPHRSHINSRQPSDHQKHLTAADQQGRCLAVELGCYPVAMTRLIPVRLAALLSLVLLTPATVLAHEAKVTAEGMSEEFAISEAMRQIPKRSSVTDTSCRTQDIGMSTCYWCTLTYSE